MTTLKTTTESLFVTLLLDRRAHATLAVALALLASVVLGGDGALAGANLSCNGRVIIMGGRC